MALHQLIGTQVSLYTGKVRAYLRFKQIPFQEVLSTGQVYRDVIIPRTGVRFIPVLITDDDVAVQDTTDIIDALEARYPAPAVYPETPLQRLVALLLEVYGDEWLVIPAMHYRWSFEENRQFAIGEFGRTSAPDLPPEQQRELGERLAGPFAGALPRLGITDATKQAIERSYEAFLDEFERHLADHPYLLGTRPSIGDYGLVGPLYAHLWRDPYSRELMQARAPRVAQWVQRMQWPEGPAGEFLPDDRVPQTLLPLLARMFREQVPVLQSTLRHLAEWAREHPEAGEVPRGIGRHRFHIEGASDERAVTPYPLWMWQRPHDHLRAMGPEDRARARAFLGAIPNAYDALDAEVSPRVERIDNRLHISRRPPGQQSGPARARH